MTITDADNDYYLLGLMLFSGKSFWEPSDSSNKYIKATEDSIEVTSVSGN